MESVKQGVFRRYWEIVKKPSAKYSILTIASVFFIVGIIFWGGFHTVIEATNTMEFCITCHEMRDNVYQEYKETIHYSNRTGVRAICSDCHVPKSWGRKMLRKMKASFEVWGKLIGSIDTREKFEAKRMELATHEWDRMKAADSIECRNCHGFEGMNSKKQKPKAQENHQKAIAENMTCIDCHKGIAHLLPKEYKGNEDEE